MIYVESTIILQFLMPMSEEFLINLSKLGREKSKGKMYFIYTCSFSNKDGFQVFIDDVMLRQCYLFSSDIPGKYFEILAVSTSATFCRRGTFLLQVFAQDSWMTKLHRNYFLDFLLTVAICHQHFTELNLVSKIVAIQKKVSYS